MAGKETLIAGDRSSPPPSPIFSSASAFLLFSGRFPSRDVADRSEWALLDYQSSDERIKD
ncbi:hypothetical protein IHE45_16G019500 [Dioscorea alata]|uniref:Uncharacterized protein n=2 Tax=Dioscorea alata TaxID=55571 RepID=A0ACB7UFY2_DIOAL|nr:hypothetical protein IHE45_16G019300 [Dioscorea alata]KAH7659239.1 hypothetical protein IHE45_16G019500 [Dioscorea alata]